MRSTDGPSCTFTNPLVAGADPWVIRKDSAYYYIRSSNNRIWISTARTLTGVFTSAPSVVWSAPDTGWNRGNVWAPELHFIDGRWYIYYAAGKPGAPFTSQRAGVLQSEGSDAIGAYVDRGMLYTGDSVETGRGNRWAIDLTVARVRNRLYAVWSGWAENATTDKTPQQLYIAPMLNPWTIGANRVMLSAPDATWERGPELDLEEGPEFLQHNGDVFLVYSTRDSWLKEYALGQLHLRAPPADPLDPASWEKSGPVFVGTGAVHGVGHASFTTSPDASQDWIVYHSKRMTTPGWDRDIRMQRFTWSPTGTPLLGEPVRIGIRMARPAGECPQ
jgi:GH43 family beta-xylosidase